MKLRKRATTVYELVAHFLGREATVRCQVEEAERQRLLDTLASASWQHPFYDVDLPPGQACLLNTTRLRRLNVLDPLAGLPVEAATDQDPDELLAQAEERAASDVCVYLRLWLRGQEQPVLHSGIDHATWQAIHSGILAGARFIAFADEDVEDVLYGTDFLDAVQMFDPFHLDASQLAELLGTEVQDPDIDNPSPPPPANGPVPF